jgi:hypothetical protein
VDPVGVRLQGLDADDRVLTVARMAQARSDAGVFAPAHVDALLDSLALPRPAKMSNVLAGLEKAGHLTRLKGKRGAWKLTPVGLARSRDLASDIDLVALAAEASTAAPLLGHTAHPVIEPSLAPPELVGPLRGFLDDWPFERNVFGMTRFPQTTDEDEEEDPVAPALRIAREVCADHGLTFHLASDRQIVDDLWANVAAHMWACHYGIAFFEDRAKRGINYNLTIEVGSMLVLGRRVAILKDTTVKALPTDLTGRIYKSVDLKQLETVRVQLGEWVTTDLGLGK